jgi:hypothetical protein
MSLNAPYAPRALRRSIPEEALMTTAEPVGLERRRVRRSGKVTKKRMLHNPRAGAAIGIGVAVLAALYGGVCLRAVDQASRSYALLAIDSHRSDVRYLLGRPVTAASGGALVPAAQAPNAEAADMWGYATGSGGNLQVGFDPGGDAVARIACEDEALVATSCPPVLGLQIGASEDEIWYKLGTPTSQRYRGEVKLLRYDELGLTFALKRYMLYSITLNRRGGGGFLARAARYLVP